MNSFIDCSAGRYDSYLSNTISRSRRSLIHSYPEDKPNASSNETDDDDYATHLYNEVSITQKNYESL